MASSYENLLGQKKNSAFVEKVELLQDSFGTPK